MELKKPQMRGETSSRNHRDVQLKTRVLWLGKLRILCDLLLLFCLFFHFNASTAKKNPLKGNPKSDHMLVERVLDSVLMRVMPCSLPYSPTGHHKFCHKTIQNCAFTVLSGLCSDRQQSPFRPQLFKTMLTQHLSTNAAGFCKRFWCKGTVALLHPEFSCFRLLFLSLLLELLADFLVGEPVQFLAGFVTIDHLVPKKDTLVDCVTDYRKLEIKHYFVTERPTVSLLPFYRQSISSGLPSLHMTYRTQHPWSPPAQWLLESAQTELWGRYPGIINKD